MMMSPGDDQYIKNTLYPLIYGVAGIIVSYILMHREIKR